MRAAVMVRSWQYNLTWKLKHTHPPRQPWQPFKGTDRHWHERRAQDMNRVLQEDLIYGQNSCWNWIMDHCTLNRIRVNNLKIPRSAEDCLGQHIVWRLVWQRTILLNVFTEREYFIIDVSQPQINSEIVRFHVFFRKSMSKQGCQPGVLEL